MEEPDTRPDRTKTGAIDDRESRVAGEETGRIAGGQCPEEIRLYIGSHADGAFYCSWNGTALVIEAPAGCDPYQVVLAGNHPGPREFARLQDDLDTLGVWCSHPGERACGCAGVVHYLFRIRWGQRSVDWCGSFDPVADPQIGEWLAQIQNALLRLRGPCQEETISPGKPRLGEESRDGR